MLLAPATIASDLTPSQKNTSQATLDPLNSPTETPPPLQEPIESAFDIIVGGNYYGWVSVLYTDEWIEIVNPQEAIYQLPIIKDRQALSPLFAGKLSGTRDIPRLGSLTVDNNAFAIRITIAPEQSLNTPVTKEEKAIHEGAASFITLFSARGNQPTHSQGQGRISYGNTSRITYKQHRILNSGVFDSQQENYELNSLRAETDLGFAHPLTLSGGLHTTPGQPFASSTNMLGLSLNTNRKFRTDNTLLSASPLNIYVPTRALVEVFRDNAESGEVLFSRILNFGNIDIDTRQFPPGSYSVIVVVSVDGAELSRTTEQFYKYDQILPREQFDLSLFAGKVSKKLDTTEFDLFYGSIRKRLSNTTEGTLSLYNIGDRLILNQGYKGIFESQKIGVVNFEVNLSESNSTALLGYSFDTRWRKRNTSANFRYRKSFEDDIISDEKNEFIAFPERSNTAFRLNHAFDGAGKSLFISFNAQQSKIGNEEEQYRYGPSVRWVAYRSRSSSLSFSAQRDMTNAGPDTRFDITYSYREGQYSSRTFYNQNKTDFQNSNNLQTSLAFQGDPQNQNWLGNAEGSITYSKNENEIIGHTSSQRDNLSLEGKYYGKHQENSLYYNHSSNAQAGNYGGEVLTTVVLGENNLKHLSRTIPLNNAIAAITVNGDKSDALLSVLVDGSQKAYFNIGETAFVDIPVYRTSKITIKSIENGEDMVRILAPQTTIAPYPGNIIHRVFDAVKLVLVEGKLLDENGQAIKNTFFETGSEPAYTGGDGGFVVELPLYLDKRIAHIIVNNRLCQFHTQYRVKQLLVEAGELTCLKAPETKLKAIRKKHDKTRKGLKQR
ncbi:MAG: TcfC E-set like domain-containing protein [Agarilytica sp.]